MLTTDGIHGSLPESELVEMISDRKHALGTVTDDIATTVDGKGRTAGGGHDNLTIAIIETKINSKLKTGMSKKTKIVIGIGGVLLVLSLVLNGLLLGHTSSDAKYRKTIEEKERTIDSLKSVKADTKNVEESAEFINALKADNRNLSKQLTDKEKENKALRQELDNYKKRK